MNKDWYALLDVGGTTIKRQAVYADGTPAGRTERFQSMSAEDADTVITNLVRIICGTSDTLPAGIAMAFPGPFDYINGISHMQGLGKYDSIYGLPLRPMLAERLGEDIPILFINDVEAFALGAVENYPDAKKGKCIAIAIGTGCGSAFISDGRIIKEGDGVPYGGWVYSYPLKDSCIDDYISARGQARLSIKYFGKDIEGKELDRLASEGNRKAEDLFNEFGEMLLEALQPFLSGFQPSSIILGGMISRSFRYFGKSLSEYAEKNDIRIIAADDTSKLIHKGLFQLIKGGLDA